MGKANPGCAASGRRRTAGRGSEPWEVCDGIDNDCDEQIDVNAVDGDVWDADRDHDGYGDAGEGEIVCEPPENAVPSGRLFDCADSDPDVRPSATDRPGDGVDQDCDGQDAHRDCGGCSTPSAPPLASLTLLAALVIRRRGDRSRRPLAGPPARPAEEQHGERDAQGTRP